jgi:hypothetical protein
LKELARSLYPERDLGQCVTCGKQVTGFRDELSRKEYEISGMCQECQDGIEETWDEIDNLEQEGQ